MTDKRRMMLLFTKTLLRFGAYRPLVKLFVDMRDAIRDIESASCDPQITDSVIDNPTIASAR